jgi:hypothetical protein
MDSRQYHPKEVGGKDLILIARVRVGVRGNRIGDPGQSILLHRFRREVGNYLFWGRTLLRFSLTENMLIYNNAG